MVDGRWSMVAGAAADWRGAWHLPWIGLLDVVEHGCQMRVLQTYDALEAERSRSADGRGDDGLILHRVGCKPDRTAWSPLEGSQKAVTPDQWLGRFHGSHIMLTPARQRKESCVPSNRMRYLPFVTAHLPASLWSCRRGMGLFLAVLAAAGSTGCKDIERFSTGPGESYCGTIVPGPFVRGGFGPGVRMRMTLDTDHLNDAPGMVTTDDGLFSYAVLRPIPQLAHDSLSTFNFGEGRERNLLFGVRATEGAQAFAVVSLLENGDVEVRVLRGAGLLPGESEPLPAEGPQLYGIFPMVRQQGTCGF